MTGRRWQVRQTIERMILNTRANKYRGTCDKSSWFYGPWCCKHHDGILRKTDAALKAIAAFTGDTSIQALIDNGFSEKAILHFCHTIAGLHSMDEFVRAKVRLRRDRARCPRTVWVDEYGSVRARELK